MNIEWNEDFGKLPTTVITLNINGRDFIMDLITYNENIEAGKTKYVVSGDMVKMVTPEQYNLIKEFNDSYTKYQKSGKGDFLGFSRLNVVALYK